MVCTVHASISVMQKVATSMLYGGSLFEYSDLDYALHVPACTD